MTMGMDPRTLLWSAEHRGVDPLRKFMLIGGRVDSNLKFQSFKGSLTRRIFGFGGGCWRGSRLQVGA
jgi:hypothetical protein